MSLPVWPEGVRCETCRHWQDADGQDYLGPVCSLGTSKNRQPVQNTSAWADPCDKWWGYLITSAEHACNQWEPKTP